ncbi:hypothetical protein B0T18DRAFT_436766 [Schizothecium vesticola]|uniref:Uncharacterized protein n=1 Tax=Schizothecium vesticola TaxID=314040 RepID=A0AA40F0X6_9PEZI|nr:hypothetical protein B0T18DRAFT_436766 [Schizothecium vesticola]
MHAHTFIQLLAVAGTAAAATLTRRECGEKADQFCFGRDGGTPSQKIDVEDLQYVAAFLRNVGKNAAGGAGAFYTMPSGVECEEWAIEVPGAGTVLALAKHINPRTLSSVLLTDIADTIDGGSNTNKAKSLLGCGTGGGWLGVATNATDPAYNTATYKASKAKPQDIIIKIVHA